MYIGRKFSQNESCVYRKPSKSGSIHSRGKKTTRECVEILSDIAGGIVTKFHIASCIFVFYSYLPLFTKVRLKQSANTVLQNEEWSSVVTIKQNSTQKTCKTSMLKMSLVCDNIHYQIIIAKERLGHSPARLQLFRNFSCNFLNYVEYMSPQVIYVLHCKTPRLHSSYRKGCASKLRGTRYNFA